jgi:hypothetical protein
MGDVLSGSYNIAVGFEAGNNGTFALGDYNIFIGSPAYGQSSNTIRICTAGHSLPVSLEWPSPD